MSSFLTIGGAAYEVLHQGASENEPTLLGVVKRSLNGTMRVRVRGTKRAWAFTLKPMDDAAYENLQFILGGMLGTVQVGGDALPGAGTFAALVRIKSADYVPNDIDFLRTVALSIEGS